MAQSEIPLSNAPVQQKLTIANIQAWLSELDSAVAKELIDSARRMNIPEPTVMRRLQHAHTLLGTEKLHDMFYGDTLSGFLGHLHRIELGGDQLALEPVEKIARIEKPKSLPKTGLPKPAAKPALKWNDSLFDNEKAGLWRKFDDAYDAAPTPERMRPKTKASEAFWESFPSVTEQERLKRETIGKLIEHFHTYKTTAGESLDRLKNDFDQMTKDFGPHTGRAFAIKIMKQMQADYKQSLGIVQTIDGP